MPSAGEVPPPERTVTAALAPNEAERLLDQAEADYWKREALQARDELRRLQQAHELLLHREWFAVKCEDPAVGRGIADDEGRYTLFFCTRAGTFPCCTLGPKDVLLVGRHTGTPEREEALAALADAAGAER